MSLSLKMKVSFIISAVLCANRMVLCSCSGEDRSDEMPRIPVVSTVSATVNGNSCTMNGTVVESHNSSLRECGFFLWRDRSCFCKNQSGYNQDI